MITTTETMEGFSPSPSPVIINGSNSPSQHSAPSSTRLSNGATATPPKHKPMKKKPSPSHASVFKGSAITPCTECGKRFHSWKALFGHMRCHPDRPYRGMNMKHQKPKPKPKPKPKSSKLLCGIQEEIRNWEHITDGVTRAALILMEMSGQSVEHIVESMKARVDVDSRLIDTQKKFAKLEIVA